MEYIKINPADNVAVALQDLSKGAVVEGVTLSMDIPAGTRSSSGTSRPGRTSSSTASRSGT